MGCTLVLNVKENQILRVTSDKDLGINRGWTCVKGRFGFDYVHSPDRLAEPLIREGGTLRPASWDEALDRAAEGLKRVKAKYGPEAIGVLVSAKCTNEENYLLQKMARAALGTNNGSAGSGRTSRSKSIRADCLFSLPDRCRLPGWTP